jgi:hypothetical protein
MNDPVLFGGPVRDVPGADSDVAYTPDAVADALVKVIAPELKSRVAWEPCAGGGAFVRALHGARAKVVASDIHDGVDGWMRDGAVTSAAPWNALDGFPPTAMRRPAAIVTNPAFSILDDFLPMALDVADQMVALLLIGQWLAPACRDYLWERAVPDEMYWLRERVAFVGPGRDGVTTDTREYAWVVWRKRAGSWMGRGLVRRLSWRDGRTWSGTDAR